MDSVIALVSLVVNVVGAAVIAVIWWDARQSERGWVERRQSARRAWRETQAQREKPIGAFTFPGSVRDAIRAEVPGCRDVHVDLVLKATRDYLRVLSRRRASRGRSDLVGVWCPSRVVWRALSVASADRGAWSALAEIASRPVDTEAADLAVLESVVVREWLGNTLRIIEASRADFAATAAGDPLLFAIDTAVEVPDGYRFDRAELDRLRAAASPFAVEIAAATATRS
jgi:hypothetical protein